MAYITQAAFEARFLAAEVSQLLAGRSDAFTRCLEDAEGEINGYISVRYVLPITPPTKQLAGLAADITRYRLYDDAAPEQVIERYKAAVHILKDIAAGKSNLIGDNGLPLLPPTAGNPLSAVAPTRKLVYGEAFVSAYDTQNAAVAPWQSS